MSVAVVEGTKKLTRVDLKLAFKKELEALKKNTNLSVIKLFQAGRYVGMAVTDEKEIRGIGLSRCSEQDSFNQKKAEEIALGRAYKALALKRTHQPLREWYLG